MKNLKLYCILFAVVVSFNECSKSGSSSGSISYTVNGLSDITINQYADTTIYVTAGVNYLSGPQETVTLTPNNLPSGITVSPTTESGTPSFSSLFAFNIFYTVPGTYPVSIVAFSSTTNKTFTFNVIVAPSTNCNSEITGSNWKTTTDCSPDQVIGAGTGVVSPYSNDNVVVINNLASTYGAEVARLDCTDGTISTDLGHNIITGTFNNNNIVYNYFASGNTCTTTFSR